MTSENSVQQKIPSMQFVFLAFWQGIVLFALHQTIEHDVWPATDLIWLLALYSMVIAVPLLFYLTGFAGERGRWRFYSITAFVTGVLGAYTGSQMEPQAIVAGDYVMLSYVPSAVVAVFLTALLRVRLSQGLDWYYTSWRIAITAGWAWVFTFACFLVLSLWGGLFQALDISFFRDIFTEKWFFYPFFSVAFAAGVIVFRTKSNFSESLIRLQQIATPFFLVIAVCIVLMFVATLPFTGLEPLWDRGGSILVLGFQALILSLMNAAYHGDEARLPTMANRLVKIGLMIMPLLSGIIAYGLYLRVAQYGWTISRLWGVSIAVLFGSFGLFYAYAVARSGAQWLSRIDGFNGRLAWLVLAFVVLVNTPLLDFRQITVSDQLDRIEQGLMSPEDLDIWYLGKQTGRAGYLALQDVKTRYGKEYPNLADRIDRLDWDADTEAAELTLESLESTFIWADAQQAERSRALTQALLQEIKESPWIYTGVSSYRVFELDVNRDGDNEYLLVAEHEFELSLRLYLASEDSDTGFASRPIATPEGAIFGDARKSFLQSLDAGKVQLVQPQWEDIVIGEQRLKVR